jgi:putative pyoverdin transport system ATP-binding/permease protein
LRRGEVVLVSGPPGSGKSTLAKLVSGLYWPAEGRVLVNGQPVPAEAQQEYREHSAAIFADSHRFEGLRSLPTSGRTPELEALAQAFQVDGAKAGNGSVDGEALTPEQRRRLALLDLLALDRALYVLDEWTLGQDPEFKEVFYSRFLPELRRRGKIVLVTSNEERFFGAADRCLRLGGQTLS